MLPTMLSIMPPIMLSAATNDGARAAYCTAAEAGAGAVGTPCTSGGGGCMGGNSCLALSTSVGFSFPACIASAWSGMLLPASTSTRYLEPSVPSEKTDENTRLSIQIFVREPPRSQGLTTQRRGAERNSRVWPSSARRKLSACKRYRPALGKHIREALRASVTSFQNLEPCRDPSLPSSSIAVRHPRAGRHLHRNRLEPYSPLAFTRSKLRKARLSASVAHGHVCMLRKN